VVQGGYHRSCLSLYTWPKKKTPRRILFQPRKIRSSGQTSGIKFGKKR
jgi:hypothetical protein